MIRNVVEAVEQLSDGLVWATVVFYSDDGSYGKERWQTVVEPATPEQLEAVVTQHAAEITQRLVDPVQLKTLMEFVGTEIVQGKG